MKSNVPADVQRDHDKADRVIQQGEYERYQKLLLDYRSTFMLPEKFSASQKIWAEIVSIKARHNGNPPPQPNKK